jgi:glycosyltransferase involved in cell wall biosynthesis
MPTTTDPNLSVAICTRGRGALITATLESVLAGSLLPAEVLVVDQSDDDTTADAVSAVAARHPIVRLVRTDTRGLSRARNLALSEARTDLVAFTDDDVTVAPDWLATVSAEFAAHSDLALLFGTVLPPESYDWRTEFVPYSCVPTRRPVRLFERAALSGMGANMSLRRSLCLPALGGFDEALGAGTPVTTGEDWEYALRALTCRPAPLRVHTLDDARVVHEAGARRGAEYHRFVRSANGTGQGLLWAHLLRAGRGRRLRYLAKLWQEDARTWAGFAGEALRGRRPTGVVTYACRVRALAAGLLRRPARAA